MWGDPDFVQTENTVYLNNLPVEGRGSIQSVKQLKSALADAGYNVISAKIHYDSALKKPKPSAFVTLDRVSLFKLRQKGFVTIAGESCYVKEASKPSGATVVPPTAEETHSKSPIVPSPGPVSNPSAAYVHGLPPSIRTPQELIDELSIFPVRMVRFFSLEGDGRVAEVCFDTPRSAQDFVAYGMIKLNGASCEITQTAPFRRTSGTGTHPTTDFSNKSYPIVPSEGPQRTTPVLPLPSSDVTTEKRFLYDWRRDSSPVLRRKMITIASPSAPSDAAADFSFLTWNVLAQKYVNSHEIYCPSQYLEWSHRFPRIKECVKELAPTALAFQEVDDGTMHNDLRMALEGLGYEVFFQRKNVGGNKADGCLLAVLASQFEVLDRLFMPSLRQGDPQCAVAVLARWRAQSRHSSHEEHIAFVTTHLKAPKLEEDIRIEQASQLFEDVRQKWGNVHLIVGGDFNSEPRWGLVEGIQNGKFSKRPLGEVYSDHWAEAFVDKRFTCMMPHMQDQLDYIFHSPELTPLRLLRVCSDLDVVSLHQRDSKMVGSTLGPPRYEMLPTPSFPSDHLPIMSVFTLEKLSPNPKKDTCSPAEGTFSLRLRTGQPPKGEAATRRKETGETVESGNQSRKAPDLDFRDHHLILCEGVCIPRTTATVKDILSKKLEVRSLSLEQLRFLFPQVDDAPVDCAVQKEDMIEVIITLYDLFLIQELGIQNTGRDFVVRDGEHFRSVLLVSHVISPRITTVLTSLAAFNRFTYIAPLLVLLMPYAKGNERLLNSIRYEWIPLLDSEHAHEISELFRATMRDV